MFAVSRHRRRVTPRPWAPLAVLPVLAVLAAVAVAAMAPGLPGAPARAETAAPAPTLETPPELGVLPTMKGHMGRLGTLMNIVFRSMRRPDGAADALAAIEEMRLHLERTGDTLIPDKVAAIEDAAARDAAIAEYKACMDQTIAQLDALAEVLRAKPPADAYDTLIALDRQRRDCHGKYAQGPAPTALA